MIVKREFVCEIMDSTDLLQDMWSRYSSVDLGGRPEFDSRQGQDISHFSTASRPTLGHSTSYPVGWVRVVDFSPPPPHQNPTQCGICKHVRGWVSIGRNWISFFLREEAEFSLRNLVLNKTGRWIMSRKSVILLVCHGHELFRSYSDIVVEKLILYIQYCSSVNTAGLEIIN
jgi:hypothetical protein